MKKNNAKSLDFVFVLGIVAIFLSFILGNFIINTSSEKTKEFGKMLVEKENIEKINSKLLIDIYSLGSLENILEQESVFKSVISEGSGN
jgi:hypothetical protein